MLQTQRVVCQTQALSTARANITVRRRAPCGGSQPRPRRNCWQNRVARPCVAKVLRPDSDLRCNGIFFVSGSARALRPYTESRSNKMTELDVEQAYQRYFPIVREKCCRMLNDPTEAQDLAQETFTRLWSNRRRFRNNDGVASWVYRTSTRLAVDRHRRLATASMIAIAADDLLDSQSESPESQAHARQLLGQLVGRIPAKELEVAILSRIDGLTHEEIGRVIEASDRTVRRLLTRFESRLSRLTRRAA